MLSLKALFWCTGKQQGKYNVDEICGCLTEQCVSESLVPTSLGKNLCLLMEIFPYPQCQPLLESLARLRQSQVSKTIEGKDYELGHYVRALQNFGEVKAGDYGVLFFIDYHLQGLFLLTPQRLAAASFIPDQIDLIYGILIKP